MGKLDVGERTRLDEKALFVRLETLRLTRIAGAGHYSGTFSAAEILAALYYHELSLIRLVQNGRNVIALS